MIIYFSLLIIVTCSAFISQKTRNAAVTRFFVGVTFACMVLVAGLRGRSVGTDTEAYVDSFKYQKVYASAAQGSGLEPGYLLLQVVAHQVSDDYSSLLTMIAIVAVFCYMRSICLFSVNPAFAFFVFITMGFYTFFFNGARQGIACAIYALSLGALIEGNFKRYCLWVMLAFFFHKTVIIALPLYFLFRQKTTVKYVLLMILLAAGGILFMGTIVDLGKVVSDKYAVYQEMEATGGKMLTLFYVLLSFMFLYFRSRISAVNQKEYDCFLNMLIVGTAIFLAVTLSGTYVEVTRMASYFLISIVFLWPILFRNIHSVSERQFLTIIAMSGHLVFYYIFLAKMAGLTPYHFNETVMRLLT